jgi:anti-anti-sigma factor
MSQAFTIKKTEGRITILHLIGHLDGQTEALVLQSAQQAQAQGARYLVADLVELEMITSAGLRALHNIYKLLTPHDEIEAWHQSHAEDVFKSPYFKLAGASSQVYYILSIAGFLQNIPIFPTLQEALDSFPK